MMFGDWSNLVWIALGTAGVFSLVIHGGAWIEERYWNRRGYRWKMHPGEGEPLSTDELRELCGLWYPEAEFTGEGGIK